MKCQILFSIKNKKNVINLSPAEFAHRVVKGKFRKENDTLTNLVEKFSFLWGIFVFTGFNHFKIVLYKSHVLLYPSLTQKHIFMFSQPVPCWALVIVSIFENQLKMKGNNIV